VVKANADVVASADSIPQYFFIYAEVRNKFGQNDIRLTIIDILGFGVLRSCNQGKLDLVELLALDLGEV
jgi:cellobiose-specific phosphotransferase system component IIB